MMRTLINALIFSPAQMAICIIVGIVFAALVGLNIYLLIIYRVKQERKMYDEQLQQRRNALLDKLEYLKSGGEPEKRSWLNFTVDDEEDEREEESEDGKKYVTVRMAVGDKPVNAEIIAVDDMSPRVRRKLGFRAKRHNGKKYYARYSLGFDAKLRYSDDETKARYVAIMDEIHKYGGINVVRQFSNIRICSGKDTLAMLLFGGKRICVAFALDPAQYEKTKYRGEDKSEKKMFAKTPMLVRVGSDEKTEIVKYLINTVAKQHSLPLAKPRKIKYDLTERSQEEMIAKGSVRVIILDEAHDIVQKKTPREQAAEEVKTDVTAHTEAAEDKTDVTVPTVVTASVPQEKDETPDTALEVAAAKQ